MKKIFKLLLVIIITIVVIKASKIVLKKYIYPKEYDQIVHMVSKKYDIDENLIYAMIKVESNFNDKATSKANAKGLMQIMDDTAIEIANKLEIDDFDVEMLYDPKINIQIGARYFKDLLNKYDNNTPIALIAYNAGQGNIDKWLDEKKITYDESSLSNIPYEETNMYWQKIMREYNGYNKIYSN